MNDVKTIGDISGKWAVLFQALMVIGGMAIPFGVTFCTWMVLTIFDVKTDISILQERNEMQAEGFRRMEVTLKEMREELKEQRIRN